jgi:glycosyltransferase involved in cell wall biosynthesis
MSPRVSVITPVYNPKLSDWVKSRASVLEQTSKDFEWIVVDDGSTEDRLFEYDILLDRNYGPSVARNVGFQISSGDIITYLDLGDELHPNRVENLIKLFSHNVELCFSAYNITQGTNSVVFDHLEYIGKPKYPTAFEYVQLLRKQNIAIPLGVAHTRRPFVECGGFQRGIVCGEDGILWRRMLDKTPLANILFSNDVAGTYYINSNGQSRTQRRFEMGGFAFDGGRNDNGAYLDEEWFRSYNSKGLYD